MMLKVLSIFGTRPEAIKMAPVVIELQKYPEEIISRVCVTGQHREMLDHVLNLFSILPDIDLNLMKEDQTLSGLTSRVIERISKVLFYEKPDVVLVQGDTTTVMAAALAAFYQKIRVGHIEAGLRSQNIYSPFPEELNRRIASVISSYHFAPTQTARTALLNEGVCEHNIYVTGNTVIDALHLALEKPVPRCVQKIVSEALATTNTREFANDLKLILVTAHRRENFGQPLESICRGIKALVKRNPNVFVVYPVHLNPNVQEPVRRILGNVERIILVNPVEYDVMAHLMKTAYLILTDSGGIQEEAPSLGKPVLVMRTETERPEAIIAGTAKLVGLNESSIIYEVEVLLNDQNTYQEMAYAINPYGDGNAAKKIVEILRNLAPVIKPTGQVDRLVYGLLEREMTG